jgi:hypothetical protein
VKVKITATHIVVLLTELGEAERKYELGGSESRLA